MDAGTISVEVVGKRLGGFKEIMRCCVGQTEEESDRLYAKASEWVRRYSGQHEGRTMASFHRKFILSEKRNFPKGAASLFNQRLSLEKREVFARNNRCFTFAAYGANIIFVRCAHNFRTMRTRKGPMFLR